MLIIVCSKFQFETFITVLNSHFLELFDALILQYSSGDLFRDPLRIIIFMNEE